MNTWGAWASSGKGQPHCLLLQQKQGGKKNAIFHICQWNFQHELENCRFVFSLTNENATISCPFQVAKESTTTRCKWVVLKTSPPSCLQRSSRFIRRLNYRVPLVELQELQNSEGRGLNPLLLELLLFEKDIVLNFHMPLFPWEVGQTTKKGKKKNQNSRRAHSLQTHTPNHFLAIEWVQSESSFQTISLSNTVALMDRRQIRRAMATVKCESGWWEECVCVSHKLVG